jgi:osmotically-inducible protein OsmY
MRQMLLVLTGIALALSPAVSLAQSTATDARKTAKADEAARPARDGAGQAMKDSWLTTKTKMALVKDGRVRARHIKVETQGGVVTLRGKVASAGERTAAEEIVRRIKGATSVSNALQVVPEAQRKSVDTRDDAIEQAVKGRLDKDARLKAADIKVRSDNSVVTLIGKVPDINTKTRAADLTRGVPGVKAVRNELTQKG